MTRNRRRLGLIAAALIVSAGIYGLWWDRAARAAQAELEHWIEARRAAGFEIAHGGIETTGFPMRIDLAVTNPRVSRAGRHPFAWQGPERLVARINPAAPARLDLDAGGTHHLTYLGREMTLTAGAAEASLSAGAQGFDGLRMKLDAIRLSGAFSSPVALEHLALDVQRRLDTAAEDMKTPTGSLSLEARQLTLPPEARPLLGPDVPNLSLRLSLYGPFPESLDAEPLAAWSEAGGTLEIEHLHLEWPPLILDGDGTLALDRRLMPIAPFGLKAKGVFETVDALERRGFVEPSAALPVKIALAVLAKEPPDPETGLMRLPITLQGRGLFIGPARLADFPVPPWTKNGEEANGH